MKVYNLIKALAEIKIRLDRGNALVYWLRNLVIIVAGFKIIIGEMSLFQSFLLGLFLVFGFYFLGWLDLNKFKLFQQEAELNTGKYNPFFKRKLR